MGIKTVAVYSDADATSMYVKEADEAYRVGPAPSNQSYLKMDTMVDVMKASGAQAVHPGYGFLSENPKFQQLLQANDLTFIGPGTKAIIAMGDKIASKKISQRGKSKHCSRLSRRNRFCRRMCQDIQGNRLSRHDQS
jgi:propionyl-CoA carboxylase alpha chain